MLARALSRLRQVEQQAVNCIAAERLWTSSAGPLFHSCAAAEQPSGAAAAGTVAYAAYLRDCSILAQV